MKQILFLVVAFVAMSIQLVRSAETPTLIERPAAGHAARFLFVDRSLVTTILVNNQQTVLAKNIDADFNGDSR
jgi:hypothetical protein